MKKCYRRSDRQVFAVKISEVEEEHALELQKLFLTKKRLGLFKHPSILQYHELYIMLKRRTCYIVMDYIPHPNLGEVVHSKAPPLTECEVR